MIGIFDSGVGGLSVLRSLRLELPCVPLIYVADQAHVPYGPRPLEQVRQFSTAISRFLIDQGTQLIVVACNAASAAALHHLRTTFPDTPFVGMEPAVKPAAEHTQTGVVGVLATPATFQGELYASVVERFANGVSLVQHTCPGLVGQIEAGALRHKKTRRILETALQPMLDQGIDTVVLGCTHYPFVIPLIQDLVGPDVRVIDPAPAVARQARRVWQAKALQPLDNMNALAANDHRYFTTGDPVQFSRVARRLLKTKVQAVSLSWVEPVFGQPELQ